MSAVNWKVRDLAVGPGAGKAGSIYRLTQVGADRAATAGVKWMPTSGRWTKHAFPLSPGELRAPDPNDRRLKQIADVAAALERKG